MASTCMLPISFPHILLCVSAQMTELGPVNFSNTPIYDGAHAMDNRSGLVTRIPHQPVFSYYQVPSTAPQVVEDQTSTYSTFPFYPHSVGAAENNLTNAVLYETPPNFNQGSFPYAAMGQDYLGTHSGFFLQQPLTSEMCSQLEEQVPPSNRFTKPLGSPRRLQEAEAAGAKATSPTGTGSVGELVDSVLRATWRTLGNRELPQSYFKLNNDSMEMKMEFKVTCSANDETSHGAEWEGSGQALEETLTKLLMEARKHLGTHQFFICSNESSTTIRTKHKGVA